MIVFTILGNDKAPSDCQNSLVALRFAGNKADSKIYERMQQQANIYKRDVIMPDIASLSLGNFLSPFGDGFIADIEPFSADG